MTVAECRGDPEPVGNSQNEMDRSLWQIWGMLLLVVLGGISPSLKR